MQKTTNSKKIDYSKDSTLKAYAIWYYQKYFPSKWKLRLKLLEKNWDSSKVNSIMEELKDIFMEDYLAESQIKNLLDKWKNDSFIINKLIQKHFEGNNIKKILLDLKDNRETTPEYLKGRFLYMVKSKSLKITKLNLLKQWYDKDLIEEIASELNIKDDDDKISMELNKLTDSWFQKEKIIQKMISKWYNYSDFKKYFN